MENGGLFCAPWLRTCLLDVENPNSFAVRFRAARFRRFEAWMASIPRPVTILDIGGRTFFWEERGFANRADIQIVSVNLLRDEQRYENLKPVIGDATNLPQFADRSFDIVFSNSVIEHLSTFENQCCMAKEVKRVAKRYWVQTPNFWFPLEPHFFVPGWQWLPESVRVSVIKRWKCGYYGPCRDALAARKVIGEIQLLTRRQLKILFPNATLIPERVCGLVKSWTAVGSS
jgi:hypothetical protein